MNKEEIVFPDNEEIEDGIPFDFSYHNTNYTGTFYRHYGLGKAGGCYLEIEQEKSFTEKKWQFLFWEWGSMVERKKYVFIAEIFLNSFSLTSNTALFGGLYDREKSTDDEYVFDKKKVALFLAEKIANLKQ